VRWLQGVSLMDLAPNLYAQARYKYCTISKEIHNLNWVRNLKQINSETLMDKFILLFSALNEVTLTEERHNYLEVD
jgi:hypothetical protein